MVIFRNANYFAGKTLRFYSILRYNVRIRVFKYERVHAYIRRQFRRFFSQFYERFAEFSLTFKQNLKDRRAAPRPMKHLAVRFATEKCRDYSRAFVSRETTDDVRQKNAPLSKQQVRSESEIEIDISDVVIVTDTRTNLFETSNQTPRNKMHVRVTNF